MAGHTARAAFAKPGAPVRRRYGRGGRPQHVGRPCARVLALGQVPGEYMLPRARYEHHRIPPDPNAVQEDDVVCLSRMGAMGHSPQNSLVALLSVEREHPMSDCVCPERSQRKNISRRLARESIFLTDDDPQRPHLHLCLPDEVVPFLRMALPQSPHLGLLTRSSRLKATFLAGKIARSGMSISRGAHFLSLNPIARPLPLLFGPALEKSDRDALGCKTVEHSELTT